MKRILDLDPASYRRHAIHGENRIWAETNCYVDVLIELTHALGWEPIAALPFTLAIDFEGDQWTFFKFPHADLLDLFGLEIQELQIWRPLATHVEEQVALGKPVLVELDSYFLPDTAGTAYHLAHVKSTVAVNEIDVAGRHMGYFHNQGYYHVQGDDFQDLFRLRGPEDPAYLPPYVEFVRRRRSEPWEPAALARASLRSLKRQLQLMPNSNPFDKFKVQFLEDWNWLAKESLDAFHRYSFATLRQFGACYELSATYLQWLRSCGIAKLDRAIELFVDISTETKSLQFQFARAMARKKPLDLTGIDAMAAQWQEAIAAVRAIAD